MSVPRSARFATWWCAAYTRGLGEPGHTRREELASDLFDHQHDPHHSSRELWGRVLLGIPADLSWRQQHVRHRRRAHRERRRLMPSTPPLFRPIALLGALQATAIVAIGVISWLAPDDPVYGAPSASQVAFSVTLLSLCAAFSAYGARLLWTGKRSGTASLLVPAAVVGAGFYWQPIILTVAIVCAAAYALTALVPTRTPA